MRKWSCINDKLKLTKGMHCNDFWPDIELDFLKLNTKLFETTIQQCLLSICKKLKATTLNGVFFRKLLLILFTIKIRVFKQAVYFVRGKYANETIQIQCNTSMQHTYTYMSVAILSFKCAFAYECYSCGNKNIALK